MTWFPLQAAIKMTTIPGAIRHTLDVLLDHINAWKDPSTGVTNPTQPQTLIVFESLSQLAAHTGFSMVTVADHLKRLRGDKPLRRGVTRVVLERVEEATHHRAAHYRLRPEALDRLMDHEQVKAFEESRHSPHHPYQLWRDWWAANNSRQDNDPLETAEGISHLDLEGLVEDGQGISCLYAEEGQGISSLDPRVQAPYTELTSRVDPSQPLTSFLPNAELPPEKKVSTVQEAKKTPPKPKPSKIPPVPERTPPPDTFPITEELIAWRDQQAPGVPIERVRDIWLQDCHAKGYQFRDWEGELKTQLLKAYYQAQDRAEQRARWQDSGPRIPSQPPHLPAPDDLQWVEHPHQTPFHQGGCRTHHPRWMPCPPELCPRGAEHS
jgi:hypothetical protein